MNDLAQCIERRKMLLPLMVEHLEQETLLQLDPRITRHRRGLVGHHRVRRRRQPVDEHLLIDRFFLDPGRDVEVEAECFARGGVKCGNVPLLGIGIRWAMQADERVDRLVAHVEDHVTDSIRIHDFGALVIDHLALIVHHVVILDDIFPLVVVARLDLFLRGFDRLRNPRVDDRLTLLQPVVHHPSQHVLLAEDAQQVVIEAEIKAAKARVALAARAAAQLIVDAAALVTLGAEDEQPANSADRVALGGNLGLDPSDRGITLWSCR